MQNQKNYVVVINRNGPIPLRHIVENKGESDPAAFRDWYYSNYHTLEGDEFIFIPSSRELKQWLDQYEKEWFKS